MNELEKLREWQMEASRVLSNLYDTWSDEWRDQYDLVDGWLNHLPDVKLLLKQAPLEYRRLR